MFYSHQLLAKKGPLGRIWIAATMRAKLTKKNVQAISIEETCEQIIHPPTPLALRLSGILMGGVVVVFERQQRFLYEDVNSFLVKLSSSFKQTNFDGQNLQKGRETARFETVSIATPRPASLLDSDVDPADYLRIVQGGDVMFMVGAPTPLPDPAMDRTRVANSADITIKDNQFSAGIGCGSAQDQFEDTLQPVDLNSAYFADTADFSSPAGSGRSQPTLAPIQEDPMEQAPPDFGQHDSAVPPTDGDREARDNEQQAAQRQRQRKRRQPRPAAVDDVSEIPAAEFTAWLQDACDIVVHRPVKRRPRLDIEQLFTTPAARGCLVDGTWAPQLLDLWHRNAQVHVPMPPPSPASTPLSQKDTSSAEQPFDGFGSFPSDDLGHGNLLLEHRRGTTPRTGNASTPHPAASSGASGRSGSRGHVSSHPGSGMRQPDLEMPDIDFQTDKSPLSPPVARDAFGPLNGDDSVDRDSPHNNFVGSLTQFELLEESGALSQRPGPNSSVDKMTAAVLPYLRSALDASDDKQSLFAMTAGMKASRAARMFYQVCVLTSTRYIRVEQRAPYADILVTRGPYL
eukprot:jgi/Chlat1/4466/Chrsp29S04413